MSLRTGGGICHHWVEKEVAAAMEQEDTQKCIMLSVSVRAALLHLTTRLWLKL